MCCICAGSCSHIGRHGFCADHDPHLIPPSPADMDFGTGTSGYAGTQSEEVADLTRQLHDAHDQLRAYEQSLLERDALIEAQESDIGVLVELVRNLEVWRADAEIRLEHLRQYESAITWDTTCLNCSALLDRSYEAYSANEQFRMAVQLAVLDPDVDLNALRTSLQAALNESGGR